MLTNHRSKLNDQKKRYLLNSKKRRNNHSIIFNKTTRKMRINKLLSGDKLYKLLDKTLVTKIQSLNDNSLSLQVLIAIITTHNQCLKA